MATCENFESHLSVYVRALTCWHVGRTGTRSRGTLKRLSSSLVVCLAHLGIRLTWLNQTDETNQTQPEQQAGSRVSRATICGADRLFQHPPKITLSGPSERGSLTVEPFVEY